MKTRLPSNWRDRLEVFITNEKQASGLVGYAYGTSYPLSWYVGNQEDVCVIKFKNGRTPKGFKNVIGFVTRNKKDGYIRISEIFDKRMRKRGLGTDMYETLLKETGFLHTKFHDAAEGAQGVWHHLCEKYDHDFDFWSGELGVYT